jgi:hypothetical protein
MILFRASLVRNGLVLAVTVFAVNQPTSQKKLINGFRDWLPNKGQA